MVHDFACPYTCRGDHGAVAAECRQYLPQTILPGVLDPRIIHCPIHWLEDMAVREMDNDQGMNKKMTNLFVEFSQETLLATE